LKRLSFRAGTEWDAEDIIQEAYCRALKYQESYDGKHLDQWMSTIMNNSLREHKNNEKGFAGPSFEEEEAEGTPCSYYPSRVVGEIYDLIDTKSVLQIEVLTMYVKHGYSAMDISRITDYTYAVTHQIIQRFKNELKDLYG
jgi:DNA-directed RNA polymerase specialized sigma24 family protein